MRNLISTLTSLLLLLVITSCGGSNNDTAASSAEFEMNTFSADTTCMLFEGRKGPSCDVSYKIKYATGKDASFINDIIARSIFPESDSLDIEEASHREMLKITDNYKTTLKGVTRKSINEGIFPEAMARYNRSLNTHYSIVKGSILVYTASVQEKTYGATDSLVNRFTFNISLKDRNLITHDDIFVQGHKDRLTKKIVEKLSAQYNASGIGSLSKKGIFSDGIPYASDNIIISDDAITFVYNPFEIAGRHHGIIEVMIPADEVKDIMKKEWIAFFETK